MIMLFCLCATVWAQATDREAAFWGFGAVVGFIADILIVAAIFDALGGCQ